MSELFEDLPEEKKPDKFGRPEPELPIVTESVIREATKTHFFGGSEGGLFCLHEVGSGVVYGGGGSRDINYRQIDMLFVGNRSINAIEIKVSKADLRREIKDPSKSAVWDWCSGFWLVAPEEIAEAALEEGTIYTAPSWWGIVKVKNRKPTWNEEKNEWEYNGFTARKLRKPTMPETPTRVGLRATPAQRSFTIDCMNAILRQADSVSFERIKKLEAEILRLKSRQKKI